MDAKEQKGKVTMLKIYTSEICSGCRAFKEGVKDRVLDEKAEFIAITESVANLRAFLSLRDTRPEFKDIRAGNRIGIPCFVNDDGSLTFDPNEALEWIGEDPLPEVDDGGCATCR
jgi:Glutaredoxin-related protein